MSTLYLKGSGGCGDVSMSSCSLRGEWLNGVYQGPGRCKGKGLQEIPCPVWVETNWFAPTEKLEHNSTIGYTLKARRTDSESLLYTSNSSITIVQCLPAFKHHMAHSCVLKV